MMRYVNKTWYWTAIITYDLLHEYGYGFGLSGADDANKASFSFNFNRGERCDVNSLTHMLEMWKIKWLKIFLRTIEHCWKVSYNLCTVYARVQLSAHAIQPAALLALSWRYGTKPANRHASRPPSHRVCMCFCLGLLCQSALSAPRQHK